MKENEVDVLTIKMDLDNVRNVSVGFNEDLFNAFGITFGQVADKLGIERINDFVVDLYGAIKDCLNEVKNDDK